MPPAFLLAAGLLALLVTGALVWPLLRRSRQPAARREYDLAIYRDQLSEIERDRRRGVLTAGEAEASRLEVQRRLLAADRAEPSRAGGAPAGATAAGQRDWFASLALGLLVPGLALGVYLLLGRPDLPSIGVAEQRAMETDVADLAERLRASLEAEPDNARGWELLGRTYLQLGQPGEAAGAFRRALAVGGEAGRLEASLGEALVAAAQGRVGPEARDAFARALAADPGEPRARYFAGLALVQDGRTQEGLEVWRALLAASPPDAPWLPAVERSIAALEEVPPAGPSREQVEAAGEMSDEERQAFVRSMVDRLSARLETEPGDIEGWLRLARARQVLGEPEAAEAALQRALAQLGDRPENDPQRRAVERALEELSAERNAQP